MAVVWESYASTETNITTMNAALPAGLVAGNLMLMIVVIDTASVSVVAPGPAGWLEPQSFNPVDGVTSSTSTPDERVYVYYKIAGAAETAPQIDISAERTWNTIIIRFSGVDTNAPINDIQKFTGILSSTNSHSPVNVTTTVANAMLATFLFIDRSLTFAPFSTPPAGFTERFDFENSGWVGQTGASAIQATAGTSNIAPFTTTVTDSRTNFTVAIAPAVTGINHTRSISNDSGASDSIQFAINSAIMPSDTSAITIIESSSLVVSGTMPKAASESVALSVTDASVMSQTGTISKSASDTGALSTTESSSKTIMTSKSGVESISVSLADASVATLLSVETSIPCYVGGALSDSTTGVWLLDSVVGLKDYSPYGRTAVLNSGSITRSAPTAASADSSIVLNASNTLRFPVNVFEQGRERDEFSIEAWVYPIDKGGAVAEQQVMSHLNQYDGLTINGTVASFVTKYTSTGEARATYDFRVRQNLHLVGVHTASKNQLWVNGELVSEANITDAQQKDTYITSNGNLYSGLTTGTTAFAINGAAIYRSALSLTSIDAHNTHGGRHYTPAETVGTYYGGVEIPLSLGDSDSYSRVWTTEYDWSTGFRTDLTVQDDRLTPMFIEGVSLVGTWMTTYPLDIVPTTTINSAMFFWEGQGATVEASLDGTTWTAITYGQNIPFITTGFTVAGQSLHIRVSFPAGSTNPEQYLDNLSLVIQTSANIPALETRSVTLTQPATRGLTAEPLEYRSDAGLILGAGGSITIGPDTGTDAPAIRTVEVWMLRTSATTNPSINQAGTVYRNGVVGNTTLTMGEWTLMHIVTAADITGNIVITGPAVINRITLYPALSAQSVSNIYEAYTGYQTLNAGSFGVLNTAESASPVEIYGYDWSIVNPA